jgi:hypothetical protein
MAHTVKPVARAVTESAFAAHYAPCMYTHLPGVLFLLAAACDLHRFDELVPPTVDEDPGLPSLEVNGTRLHVETYGADGDPVIVFLHGGPGYVFR